MVRGKIAVNLFNAWRARSETLRPASKSSAVWWISMEPKAVLSREQGVPIIQSPPGWRGRVAQRPLWSTFARGKGMSAMQPWAFRSVSTKSLTSVALDASM